MPGLPVLSPTFGPDHGSTTGQTSLDQKSSQEIIRETMKSVREITKGASAVTIIRSVPKQLTDAQHAERQGDLKLALQTYIKVAALLQLCFAHEDTKDKNKSLVIRKEIAQYNLEDIKASKTEVQRKLEEIERLAAIPSAPTEEPAPGPMSIAERKRRLEQNGINTGGQPKRTPVLPSSPRITSPTVSQTPLSPLSTPSNGLNSFSTSHAPAVKPSPHVLVSTASLGPPSPTSSPATSPKLPSAPSSPWANGNGNGTGNHYTGSTCSNHSTGNGSSGLKPSNTGSSSRNESPRIRSGSVQSNYSNRSRHLNSEAGPSSSPKLPVEQQLSDYNADSFNSAFPSIEELEERSPAMAFKPTFQQQEFPRPASTPNTPSLSAFNSRPASPTPPKAHERSPAAYERSPMSPTVPLKPASLTSAPRLGSSVFPKELREWIQQPILKVLLLDVRMRAEFEAERIGILRENEGRREEEDMDARTDVAIACVEPWILERENLTWEVLEDALAGGGPSQESIVFKNRHQFDRVVIYDRASETLGLPMSPAFSTHSPSFPATNGTVSSSKSPLSTLVKTIFELAPRQRALKHPPILLVGGLKGWKREFGGEFLLHGVPSGGQPSVAPMFSPPPPLSRMPQRMSMQAPMQPSVSSPPSANPHELWMPRSRTDTDGSSRSQAIFEESPRFDASGSWGSSPNTHAANGYRSPDYPTSSYKLPEPSSGYTMAESPSKLARRPAISSRPPSASISNTSSINLARTNDIPASVQYPSYTGSFKASPGNYGNMVSPPPQASVNPFLSRRRSEIQDQALDLLAPRPTSIDYPNLHGIRPPPAAASSALERQQPTRAHGHVTSYSMALPTPPRLTNDNITVAYWGNEGIRSAGLKNMGNTCYMNSTVQCLSATVPFVRFFNDVRWKESVNLLNTFGSKGRLAHSFAGIVKDMWHADLPYVVPLKFRESICSAAPQFKGSEQHDSQEFLSFLLDGLHEDFNRVLAPPNWKPPPDHDAKLELMPKQIASEQEWEIYRMRNDSLIVDFFQGQFQNRMECMTCHKTSTSYNSFMYLTLPVPQVKSKVSLKSCLDAFVKEEVMEKSDAWNCPNCKTLRRATKKLTLSRLPPILLIHLKRFQVKGHFTDKIDTFVDFPVRGLDLTDFMPPPLPPGTNKPQLNGGKPLSLDDPRTQLPPYRYDLYAVTHHFGSLSSGHYTASVASRDSWLNCDDSRVSPTDPTRVVDKSAYILFYKRTKV